MDFLASHYASSPSKPWYMYLAHEAVHAAAGSGIQAPLETVAKYESQYEDDTYRVTAAAVIVGM